MVCNPIRSILSGARARKTALSAALAFSLAASSAAPSFAQLSLCCLDPLRFDTNVVTTDLAKHLPAAGVRKYSKSVGFLRWETIHTLSVMAETRRGLSSRYWVSDTRTWSPWIHHGNPSNAPIQRIPGSGDTAGIDTGLALISGYSASGSDWIAYQGFGRPVTGAEPDFKTSLMQVNAPAGTMASIESDPNIVTASSPTLPGDFDHFNPQTGFFSPSPLGSNRLVRHVFGTGVPRGHVRSNRFASANVPLVELRREHDSMTPQWISHGVPNLPGVSGLTGVAVGPSSATSIIHNYLGGATAADRSEQRYVFVATNPAEDGYGEGINGDQVAFLKGDGQTFGWNSLGSPGSFVYGAPLAIPYYTNVPISGGLGRIVVFAVVRTGSGSHVLKSRFHDGNAWDAQWQNFGAPSELGGDKFKLTSAVVYWDGTPNQMANLRINAFGYSEELGSRKGQLVEFFWDGASWRFAAPRPAPDGESFRTSHASVIDQGTTDRIVVVGRTDTGRIYEFAREVSNGQVTSETWTDLSWERLTLTRVGP